MKLHGPEILNDDAVSVSLPDGRQVSMPVARGLIGGTVTKDGKAVTVPDTTKVPTPRQAPMGGSFEDYLAKTYGDAPTSAQILQARKDYNQADDRPRITVNTGDKEHAKKLTQAQTIARSFDTHQTTKTIQKQAEAVAFANSLNPNTKNPADDQALIYAFAKAMDPDSVVREGEYATVQKYAQSWAQTFGFNAARIFSNTAFLTPQARANMKATIQSKYAAGRAQYDNVRKEFGRRIDKITGEADGESYLTDYGGGFPSVAPQSNGGAFGFSYQDYLNSSRPKNAAP